MQDTESEKSNGKVELCRVEPKIITEKGTSKRARRPRKQPLYALGDKRVGTDLNDKNTSKRLLQASTMSKAAKTELYSKLLSDLRDFLVAASRTWQPSEECRRFTIFGDCITCACWKNEGLVSGVDIVKTICALYRLNHLGDYPRDRRKFEEGIVSDLRNLKLGPDAYLEQANSPLLKFLFRINSVRTHKRQKVFKWVSVPFHRLYIDAVDRDRRYQVPSEPSQRTNMVKAFREFPSKQLLAKKSPACSTSTEGGSPHSWGSPEDHSPSGFAVYLPSPVKLLNDDSQMNIMKLAIVADAALSRSEERSLELPPLRSSEEKADSTESCVVESLPSLGSVISEGST